MHITASDIAFDSTHHRSERRQHSVQLRREPVPVEAPRPDTVSLSERAIGAAATSPVAKDRDEGLAPFWSLVKQVLEDLLGHAIEVFRPQALGAGSAAETDAPRVPAEEAVPAMGSFSLRTLETLETLETRIEAEQLSVSARGQVLTADGRSLSFELGLLLERSHRETRVLELGAGTAAPQKKDPLVISLPGRELALAEERIEFDLDGDGLAERIPNLAGGSGFLALDRNGNGRIDDGTELFGARSGEGFAELAALDEDRNGWVDEGDGSYAQLCVWRAGAEGEGQLTSLDQAGVGALYTGHAQTAFEFRDRDNQALAALRGSGVYLSESGAAGSLQQLDYYV